MFPGFLKANDIERGKIREVVVDGANFLPMLMSGQVDAVLEQSINIGKFRRIAAEQGKTALTMRYSDFGLEGYGNAILTQPATMQNRPDLVRAPGLYARSDVTWIPGFNQHASSTDAAAAAPR
jgi:NMT1/THI5 like